MDDPVFAQEPSRTTAPRTAASLWLPDADRMLLAERAATAVTTPVLSGDLAEQAAATLALLQLSTRMALHDYADASGSPELVVSNLPEESDLPPTPVEGQTASWSQSSFSEFLILVFAAALGRPISYPDQRAGKVFHDIYPTPRNERRVSSQSSAVNLGFHVEMFFHPEPPDHLMLLCLRADPEHVAETRVAALADILGALDPADLEVLGSDSFVLDLHRLHGSYVQDGRAIEANDPRPRIAVLGGVAAPWFRFEPELTTSLTAEAGSALAHFDEAAHEVAVGVHLEPGSMLLLDNRRAAHSRSPFTAHYDGSDRWLRRCMVGRDSRNDAPFISRPGLELLRAWQAKGARTWTAHDGRGAQ